MKNDGLARRVILPHEAGYGIQIDPSKPSFTWRDLEGEEVIDVAGQNSAVLAAYRGAVRDHAFGVGDMMDVRFHIPHDIVPGHPMYVHLHWSHNGTDISGSLSSDLSYTYAKGHDQAEFMLPKLITLSEDAGDIITTPPYRHKIPEMKISDTVESASVMKASDVEIDGLILMNLEVKEIPVITGGSGKPFIHRIDIHYLSTSIGTLNKVPYFYGS
jgi:hypothetical protein